MKAARTETFAHTISGLLLKRQEMMEEVSHLRERMAVLSNDVEALDRVLETLGYSDGPPASPRAARIVLFYRNELRSYCLEHLREKGPRTSRQIGVSIIQTEGKDARDRRMLTDIVRRVSKAMRQLRQAGAVASEVVRGEYVWRLAD